MVRLFGVALILISIMGETIPARAQNPFISMESPRKISLAPGPGYPFLAKITAWQLHLNKKMTALIRQAKAAGARTLGGLPMLVCQGAAAFELWTGRAAPLEVMFRAAEEALGSRALPVDRFVRCTQAPPTNLTGADV